MEVGFSVLLPVVSALTQLSRVALAASVRRWVVEPVESRVPRSGEQGRRSPGHPEQRMRRTTVVTRMTKVKLRSATYSVSVHEATTGEELGATELSGSSFSMRVAVVRRHRGVPPASGVSCI